MNTQNPKLMYLLGHNISSSKSPELFNEYFKEHNIDMKYGIYDTDDLKSFVNKAKSVPIFAFNVTMPYKVEIIDYLDVASDTVEESKSCNLVKILDGKLYGYSTDGIGFFESLKAENIAPSVMTIIGHGGAGKSIAASAKKYGVKETFILDHNITNATITEKDTYNNVLKILKKSDLIVNASNAGYGDDNNMPIPDSLMKERISYNNDFTFVDIIYNPDKTNILELAKSLGVRNTYNGLPMLKHQFLANIDILFG